MTELQTIIGLLVTVLLALTVLLVIAAGAGDPRWIDEKTTTEHDEHPEHPRAG